MQGLKNPTTHCQPGQAKANGEQASRWRCLGRQVVKNCFLTCACLCISPLRSSKYVLSPSPPSYSASNSSFNFLFLFRCLVLALSSSVGSVSSLMSSSVSSILNFQNKKILRSRFSQCLSVKILCYNYHEQTDFGTTPLLHLSECGKMHEASVS